MLAPIMSAMNFQLYHTVMLSFSLMTSLKYMVLMKTLSLDVNSIDEQHLLIN